MKAELVTLVVVNLAHAPATVLKQAERAVSDQAAHDVRPAWNTPRVRFASRGDQSAIRVVIAPAGQVYGDCSDQYAMGCHSPRAGIVVGWFLVGNVFTKTLSHEVIETLVDPNPPKAPEVCDPVDDYTYQVDHQTVQDFILPDGRDFVAETRGDRSRPESRRRGPPGRRQYLRWPT